MPIKSELAKYISKEKEILVEEETHKRANPLTKEEQFPNPIHKEISNEPPQVEEAKTQAEEEKTASVPRRSKRFREKQNMRGNNVIYRK